MPIDVTVTAKSSNSTYTRRAAFQRCPDDACAAHCALEGCPSTGEPPDHQGVRSASPHKYKMGDVEEMEVEQAGPSTGKAVAKPSTGKRFEIKKWNAVAMWSWAICTDTCAICRNNLYEPSIEYQRETGYHSLCLAEAEAAECEAILCIVGTGSSMAACQCRIVKRMPGGSRRAPPARSATRSGTSSRSRRFCPAALAASTELGITAGSASGCPKQPLLDQQRGRVKERA
ncbi:g8386 [Coccomyxa viridis]|uniref:G8386 protein n=1 Tax=Coccomyxa viridis TaxID=1274662 RepID=A0ABP1G6P1_9CHLO